MSTVPEVSRNVRRALEAPLAVMAAAQVPAIPIEWPDIPILEAVEKVALRKFRFRVSYGVPKIETIGRTPRISMDGFASIGCFVKAGGGDDRLDDLMALIGPIYAYDANLAFGGVSVNISTLETRDAATIDSWRFRPVIVNWNVWRVA